MTRDDVIHTLTARFRKELGAGKLMQSRPAIRRITYIDQPMIMPDDGSGLHLIRKPALKLDRDEAVVAFESALDKIINPDLNHDIVMSQILANDRVASRFVNRCETIEQAVTTLVWLMSDLPGLKMILSDTHCYLETEQGPKGLVDGKIVSAFEWKYEPTPINPHAFLHEGGGKKENSVGEFIMAYGTARQRDRSGFLAKAVVVMFEAMSKPDFVGLFRPPLKMPKQTYDRIERKIFNDPDPHLAMFKCLVPRWMSTSHFHRFVGQPIDAPDLDDAVRRTYYLNRLNTLPFTEYARNYT